MVVELKLRQVGNSVGTVFPKEALAKLNAGEGDTLYLTETADGFRLTAGNPEFGKLLRSAEKVMRRYRNTLGELAK